MPRPTRYTLADGTQVPGVTTILGILNKPALIQWAYKRGKEGVPLYDTRDKAADAGTLAHAFAIAHVLSQPEPAIPPETPPEVADKAISCALTFMDWWKHQSFEIVEAEVSLVSEKYRFGGTPDVVARRGKELCILDLKTGSGIYLEARAQVAAYGQLWKECRGIRPSEFHIVRLGTEGNFTHEMVPPSRAKKYWDIFLACLDIYARVKDLGDKL